MGIGRWIGGFLGFINGGPLGALAGYAIGWLFDKGAEGFSDNADNTFDNGTYRNSNTYGGYSAQQQYEGQRNSFLFSLLVLASYIMKADGRVMHSEMELVRTFLRRNFGEIAVREGEEILLRLFERQKQMGEAAFKNTIRESCAEIAQHMDYSQRLQLLKPTAPCRRTRSTPCTSWLPASVSPPKTSARCSTSLRAATASKPHTRCSASPLQPPTTR